MSLAVIKNLQVNLALIEPETNPIPTVGFNRQIYKYKQNDITFYDLGGGVRFRGIWPRYFAEVLT